MREKFFAEAAAEYIKRISRFSKAEVVELADEKIPDNASDTVKEKILLTEGKRILGRIRPEEYVIVLKIEGKALDSIQFSDTIKKLRLSGKSDITFVIGGSLGLSEEVYARADEAVSFSKMTFPHQLMRVILLEQIYRSFKILGGEQYHK